MAKKMSVTTALRNLIDKLEGHFAATTRSVPPLISDAIDAAQQALALQAKSAKAAAKASAASGNSGRKGVSEETKREIYGYKGRQSAADTAAKFELSTRTVERIWKWFDDTEKQG